MNTLNLNKNKYHFIFPSDPLNRKKPDLSFTDQITVLNKAGFGVSCYDHDTSTIHPMPPKGTNIVYRGWMMVLPMYQRFWTIAYANDLNPLVSPDQYALCHHLPNWQSKIAHLTAETKVYAEDADLIQELPKLGWNKFFIKDFVKSLKTSLGSIADTPEKAVVIVSEIKKYRGLIEGGICVRKFEEYNPKHEERIFVLNGRAYSPASMVPDKLYDMVQECIAAINSPFFSIDVVPYNGSWRVVEIGDGQVSDLVGWDAGQFVSIWTNDEHKRY